uniref:non-specific protein-tyrosine kinase n=1 Tax=Anopheles minimus TaxID=112268 RepID=A0A182WIZ3_9DIPT
MEPKVPDLYEFLAEAELQQYYNSLKNELKITNVTHLKYATDEDLRQVSGLSRPEIRRLRKFYEKYYPHGYLNKIRRLLQTPRKDENSANSPTEQKKDYLMYRQGEIITVLDKNNNAPYWKGVLNSGKTGLFNPANTVAYLDSLPSSVNRDSLCRTAERSSKRKIRTDMISRPQNDLKHTGHVGIDGVSFGDVAFLSSPQNLPRQIVTPYKPSEDLEQTPLLLPPTPTSPDSIQTASGYFSETLQLAGHQSFINAGENSHHIIDHAGGNTVDSMTTSAFDFRNSGFKDSNPFINAEDNGDHAAIVTTSSRDGQNQHEYHEISDDDMVTEKVFDQGPSLMDEMEHVFKSMSTISEQGVPLSPDAENTNMRNELAELSSKMSRKNSSSASSGTIGNKSGGKSKAKKTSTVKPISMKDEKLLNQVIEMANEISAKSMTDLVTDGSHQTSSPKRKFSFRFPHIHNVVGGDGLRGSSHSNIAGNQSNVSGLSTGSSSHAGRGLIQDKEHGVLAGIGQHHPHSSNTLANSYREKRNFSQEVNNVPDLQRYRSLTGIERCQNSDIKIPLFDKETSDFCFKKSRELLSKQPFHITTDISAGNATKLNGSKTLDKKTRDLIGENLLDIEKTLNALNLDFLQTYHELEKADSAETLFVECYSSMMCSSSSPFQKSPPSGSLIRNSSLELSNSRGNCPLSEKGSSGSSSLASKSPPAMSLGGNGGNVPTGVSRCYSELNGTSPKPTMQQDHNNKYGIRDFKFRSFDARPKERSDYYNFKNEYLSELTRKQQSQVLGSASVLQQTAAAGSKQQQQHKISQLYQIYNTPMQGRKYEDKPSPITKTSSSSVRQRSLSFTENYDFKPSVTSKSGTVVKPQNDSQHPVPSAVVTRNVITYKPRSIRARNLRRLSYNPINMVDSSSSSSESEFDRNLVHSECDIRSRLHTTASRRRRHQYMTRKSNSNSASSQDKLYGSNASIKSAPQYNYHSDRRQYYNHFQHPSYNYADDFGTADNDEEDESIYDFSLRHARLQSEGKGATSTHTLPTSTGTSTPASTAPSGLIPATSPPGSVPLVSGGKFVVPEPTNYTNKALEREYLYSEFDVTKLTGKSPTTQSYFPTGTTVGTGQQQDPQPTVIPVTAKTNPSTPNAGKTATLAAHLQAQPQPGFQWPEKIHGAVVKHNDMLWRQQSVVQQQPVSLFKGVGQNEKHYSSDTSSTETDSIDFHRPVESHGVFEFGKELVHPIHPRESTITEEARIAYNSLVENPCTSGASSSMPGGTGLGAVGFTCSTLPRAKLTNSLTLATASFRFKDIDCCSPPSEPAPKSPEKTDLLLGEGSLSETNPLSLMRNKHFTLVSRSKYKSNSQQLPWDEQLEPAGSSNQAESPSYLTNPEYTYNNALTAASTDIAGMEAAMKCTTDGTDGASNNPIPLPPRDRNKTIPVNQKRHVRKYPLIIPAAGVQRTLNKVTQITPVDEKTDVFSTPDATESTHANETQVQRNEPDDSCNLDTKVLHKSIESIKLNEIEESFTDLPLNATADQSTHKKGYSKEFVENNFPNVSNSFALGCTEGIDSKRPQIQHSVSLSNSIAATTLPATIPAASAILTRRRTASDAGVLATLSQRRQPPLTLAPVALTLATTETELRDPTYENLDIFQTHNNYCIDTASLHCESILENDADSCPLSHGAGLSTVTSDMVDGFKPSAGLFDSINSNEKQQPTMKSVENEQSDCVVQPQTDCKLQKSMNFVSCEDLLEFAEKPKGRARGLESDEVRIMSKVLGKKPSPAQCLLTLEFIDWDIHKAIKLCKLQSILESFNLSLQECNDALQMYDWDLHTTALKLKGGNSSR